MAIESLKICSLNLAGLREWDQRLGEIVAWLNVSQPDVVLLQEVCINDDKMSQATQVNALLSNRYDYVHNAIARYYVPRNKELPPVREGLALLSRYPAITTDTLPLVKHEDDRHYRIVQLVKLEVGQAEHVNIANVHFSNNNYANEQLLELLANLDAHGDEWIIGGDFNIFDIRELSNAYGKTYQSSADSHDYISYPSENIRLDYFLLPRTYTILSFNVINGMSDHAALDMAVAVHGR